MMMITTMATTTTTMTMMMTMVPAAEATPLWDWVTRSLTWAHQWATQTGYHKPIVQQANKPIPYPTPSHKHALVTSIDGSLTVITPESFKMAMSLPHSADWLHAAHEEYELIIQNTTFNLVPPVLSHKAIKVRWVFQLKTFTNRTLSTSKHAGLQRGFHISPTSTSTRPLLLSCNSRTSTSCSQSQTCGTSRFTRWMSSQPSFKPWSPKRSSSNNLKAEEAPKPHLPSSQEFVWDQAWMEPQAWLAPMHQQLQVLSFRSTTLTWTGQATSAYLIIYVKGPVTWSCSKQGW